MKRSQSIFCQVLCCCSLFILVSLFPSILIADEVKSGAKTNQDEKIKELSGMSIVGNDEAPKSLYIVPWKGSEIGSEVNLDLTFDHSLVPIDREVFVREIKFFNLSKSLNNRR